jgi:hypothetical protein
VLVHPPAGCVVWACVTAVTGVWMLATDRHFWLPVCAALSLNYWCAAAWIAWAVSAEAGAVLAVAAAVVRGSGLLFPPGGEPGPARPGPVPPHMWGITIDMLKGVYDDAKRQAGPDFESWTMRDINNRILKPLCNAQKKSFALHHSPGGLAADVFVTHAWDEPFGQFYESVTTAFRTALRPPTLWICAFALLQGDDKTVIAAQIGPPHAPLCDTPFVQALKSAKKLLVVRNMTTDVYTRLWCVCELYYAHVFGFFTRKDVYVSGPDVHAENTTSCRYGQCYSMDDQTRILAELRKIDYKQIDDIIREIRKFAADAVITRPGGADGGQAVGGGGGPPGGGQLVEQVFVGEGIARVKQVDGSIEQVFGDSRHAHDAARGAFESHSLVTSGDGHRTVAVGKGIGELQQEGGHLTQSFK